MKPIIPILLVSLSITLVLASFFAFAEFHFQNSYENAKLMRSYEGLHEADVALKISCYRNGIQVGRMIELIQFTGQQLTRKDANIINASNKNCGGR